MAGSSAILVALLIIACMLAIAGARVRARRLRSTRWKVIAFNVVGLALLAVLFTDIGGLRTQYVGTLLASGMPTFTNLMFATLVVIELVGLGIEVQLLHRVRDSEGHA